MKIIWLQTRQGWWQTGHTGGTRGEQISAGLGEALQQLLAVVTVAANNEPLYQEVPQTGCDQGRELHHSGFTWYMEHRLENLNTNNVIVIKTTVFPHFLQGHT